MIAAISEVAFQDDASCMELPGAPFARQGIRRVNVIGAGELSGLGFASTAKGTSIKATLVTQERMSIQQDSDM